MNVVKMDIVEIEIPAFWFPYQATNDIGNKYKASILISLPIR